MPRLLALPGFSQSCRLVAHYIEIFDRHYHHLHDTGHKPMEDMQRLVADAIDSSRQRQRWAVSR